MRRLALASLAMFAALLAPARADDQRPRAVIELFTSQGCSSCPPADRLLGEYARDPTLVTLSYHVQIWDYLGWRDTLATPENTRRQKAYAEARGDRRIYTPQAVVNGVVHLVGSARDQIDAMCARVGNTGDPRALSVPVRLDRAGARVTATIGGVESGAVPARLVLVVFAAERSEIVERGENRGRTMTYTNVVRTLTDLGAWSGAPMSVGFDWPSEPGHGVALLVQATSGDRPTGVILGAAQLR